MFLETEDKLRQTVWEVVHRTPIFDIHTHIYDARFGDLLLWGIDEVLTYHYLVAEVFRYDPMDQQHFYEHLDYQKFYAMPKRKQADLIWAKVFLEHSPVSEAARGVLTTLGLLGMDPRDRNLNLYREYFEAKTAEEHINTVFHVANIEGVIMTNDPFDDKERSVWESGQVGDKRFHAALRLDGLLNNWGEAHAILKSWGYNVKDKLDKTTVAEVNRFLNEWIDRMDPLYMAVSLPPTFDAFDKSDRAKLIHKCILPVSRDRHRPFAMMIGVKKLTNPGLAVAGDSVGKATIEVVERLCLENQKNKFLVTMLSRENQHELCIAARKFNNLLPFGCWWYLNDPMTIDEMTRMRLELLGLSFIPQHSDARVLDQLLYKWAHSRWLIALVLQDKYSDLHRTGWRVTETEIERDVSYLFGGAFKHFLGA